MSADPFTERYAGYLYAYPHKSAYRRLAPVRDVGEVWAAEPAEALFLYAHVPFCEMRCGYCNLFTQSRPGEGVLDAWLRTLAVQAEVTADAVARPGRHVARMAIGGGTPTILDPGQLGTLLDLLATTFGASPAAVPTSVEVSPATATPDRLGVLAERGVERISIGVESFDLTDLRALGRPQRLPVVHDALSAIRDHGFPTLNVDLIYGAAGQTGTSWGRTLAAALEWRPEEVYAYPLYVRPRTGLDRRDGGPSDRRPELYDLAREVLGGAGYEQVSMRMWRRADAPVAPSVAGVGRPDPTAYDCQDDGMVGLGCGARSYTRALHHSHDYAVSRPAVGAIIERYLALDAAGHRRVDHGIEMGPDEQRRRFAIKGVLRRPGLDRRAYRDRFGTEAVDDLPLLARVVDAGLLVPDGRWLAPTDLGLAWSDALGPALVSAPVRSLMDAGTTA